VVRSSAATRAQHLLDRLADHLLARLAQLDEGAVDVDHLAAVDHHHRLGRGVGQDPVAVLAAPHLGQRRGQRLRALGDLALELALQIVGAALDEHRGGGRQPGQPVLVQVDAVDQASAEQHVVDAGRQQQHRADPEAPARRGRHPAHAHHEQHRRPDVERRQQQGAVAGRRVELAAERIGAHRRRGRHDPRRGQGHHQQRHRDRADRQQRAAAPRVRQHGLDRAGRDRHHQQAQRELGPDSHQRDVDVRGRAVHRARRHGGDRHAHHAEPPRAGADARAAVADQRCEQLEHQRSEQRDQRRCHRPQAHGPHVDRFDHIRDCARAESTPGSQPTGSGARPRMLPA
jgi:hypothetical protein